MDWRAAKSLIVLRTQVNELSPGRDKSSDGLLGDTRHQATKSEHNPDANGVVRAMDITHDPDHGLNARALAEALVTSRDKRIKYLISNRQIISSEKEPWTWRPYSGTNAHEHHMHISVVEDPRLYDDEHRWTFELGKPPPAALEPAGKVYRNIIATVFGGKADPNNSAYDELPITDEELGGALPFRFTTVPRRDLWVQNVVNGLAVVIKLRDVGPIYPHPDRGPADPYWLTDSRPRAETNHVMSQAGIDLTPAAARAIGIDGKGLVNWSFVTPQVTPATPPSTPARKDIPVTDTVAPVVNPLAAIEHVAETVLPIIAKFVPQLAPFVPIIQGLLQLAGDIIAAQGDPMKILNAIGTRLQGISSHAAALPAAQPVDVQGRAQ